MKKLKLMLLIGLIALSMGLAGCSGDDGATGATGPEGPPGPVTTTNESCVVCHGTDALVPVVDQHPADTLRTISATINDVTVNAAGNVIVSFTADDANGAVTALSGLTSTAFTLAQLVPGTNGDASHWESFTARARTKDASVAPVIQGYSEKSGVLAIDGLGGFTYTFALVNANTPGDITSDMATVANVTSVGGIYDKTVVATYPNVVVYDPAKTYRVGMEFKDIDGVRNIDNAFFDFVPAGGTPETRDIVTIDACNKCHGGEKLHKGYTTQYCVTCHNTSTFNPATPYTDVNGNLVSGDNDTVALKVIVHKIHGNEHLTNPDTWINGEVHANEVTFPQPANTCTACHNDDAAPGTLAQVDNWKTVPTMLACGACHDDVDFATGTNHPGGAQSSNIGCSSCHSATAIEGYHNPAPATADVPEFTATITMSDPAVGTFYTAGETPVVTVTLDNGAPVDGTVYTSNDATNDKGVVGGGLASASLYVYGPRAHALPVLTAAAATGGQSNSLLASATDTQVTTDANGFSYQLDAIPADMAPGTYMVRFEGGDYDAIAADDYVTHSTAIATFQVGTATPEAKVSGDNCVSCHGTTRMHLRGAHPHNAAFNTDECLGCHDFSGSYATPIPQRVHAVHSASDLGADGHNRAWAEVTFPQGDTTCQACHTSGNTSFQNFAGNRAVACLGCHGDNMGVEDHLLQNGGLQ